MAQFDRKLTAIYTSIETENYRGAIKLCQQRDMANVPIVLALKAYSMSCVGERSEALEIARNLMKDNPSEPTILDTIAHTFRACRAESDLAICYENALQRQPDNVQYAIELFYAYVRLHEYKKMQLISQKLFKATNVTQYLFWSVSSMLLQKDLLPAMLVVAERMLRKALFETSASVQPGAEEIELYMLVLKRANKIDVALRDLEELLARPKPVGIIDNRQFEGHGELVRMHELRLGETKIELLQQIRSAGSNSISAEEELYKALLGMLAAYPDQWSAHRDIIDLIVDHPTLGPSSASSAEPLSACVLHHRNFVLSLQQANGNHIRGPYLAEIYLLSKLASKLRDGSAASFGELPSCWNTSEDVRASENSLCSEFAKLIYDYVIMFEAKQCCFSDIKPFLVQLATLERNIVGGGRLNHTSQLMLKFQAHSIEVVSEVRSLLGDSSVESSTAAIAEIDLTAEDEVVTATTAAAAGAVSKESGGKKKKKRPAKKKQELQSTSKEGSKTPRDSLVNRVCSLCKVQQSLFFGALVTMESSTVSMSIATEQLQLNEERTKLYLNTLDALKGGVGGEKEIQPGDEVLLLRSAAHRLLHRSLVGPSTVAVEYSTPGEISTFQNLLSWGSALWLGKSMSPFNFAPKVELLEPLRALGIPDAALVCYNSLGMRYIQLDSMSYLIVPTLLEFGYTVEALKHCKAICNFHVGAVRDTAEMISKCFKLSNYSKANEMSVFMERCQRSAQLQLAKLEVSMLEFIENIHSVESANNYFKTYQKGETLEFCDVLPEEEISALSYNMDFNLLVRSDFTSHEEDSLIQNRLREFRNRITGNQLVLQILRSVFSPDSTFDLRRLLANFHATVSTPSLIVNAITFQKSALFDPFDQKIDCGGDAFEHLLLTAFEQAVVAILAFRELEQGECTEETVVAVVNDLNSKLDNVGSQLYLDAESFEKYLVPPILTSTGRGDRREFLFHPSWIRRACAFVRTIGSWLPLLLQKCLLSASSSSSSRHFSSVTSNFAELSGKLLGHLGEGKTAGCGVSVLRDNYACSWSGGDVDNIDELCRRMSESQCEICSRLHDKLRLKALELHKLAK